MKKNLTLAARLRRTFLAVTTVIVLVSAGQSWAQDFLPAEEDFEAPKAEYSPYPDRPMVGVEYI